MGQGFVIANLDKGEHINPHVFGDGYKLGEFTHGPTMDALALLLGRLDPGGRRVDGVSGRWSPDDRIVLSGDYGTVYALVREPASRDRHFYTSFRYIPTQLCWEEAPGGPEADGGKRDADVSRRVADALLLDADIARDLHGSRFFELILAREAERKDAAEEQTP